MSDFSVVIPTRDRRESVLACVASVLAQTLPPAEILVVDNGSVDGTVESLSRFASGVRVVREERPGVSRARNRGIDEARGQLVAFIDDDAVAAPDWLERLADCFEETGALGAGGPAEPLWEATPPAWLSACAKARSTVGAFDLGGPRRLLARREFLIGTNCAYRRSFFDEGHRFLHILAGRPGFGMEDVELSTKAARLGPVYYEPSARVRHAIPARKLTLSHLAACSFDNGRKKAAIGRPLMPRWERDLRGVDGFMSAFSLAGYAAQRCLEVLR